VCSPVNDKLESKLLENTKENPVMENQDALNQETSAAVTEEILDEIADLEEYAREGKQPPRCRGYRIRVNGDRFVIYQPEPTGLQIMEVAGIAPPEQFGLYLKIRGQQFERIGLDEKVDLTRPGVEKFKTLPLDQTEGLQ